ncbi:MAG: DUF6988 family protein [Acidobacteriaceae bacterium]
MDAQTENELRRAQEMHQFVADELAGEYPNDDRRALFASFLSLAQSHHEAIMVLCTHERLIGSAYALLRPLVEVTNRGLFAGFLATPEQIEKIKRGGDPYGEFNKLAAKLDEVFKTDGLFSGHAGEAWKTLNGLTHGGLEQLSRRVGENGEIGCHFEQEDVQRLLASSTSVLVRAAIQFLGAMDRQDASHAVSAKYVDLYPVPDGR